MPENCSADHEKIQSLKTCLEIERKPVEIHSIRDIVFEEGIEWHHYSCNNDGTLEYIRACQGLCKKIMAASATAGSALATGGLTVVPGAIWLVLWTGMDLPQARKAYHCIKTLGFKQAFGIGNLQIRGSRVLDNGTCHKWDELQRLLM
jgi:hypothetical protein